MKRALTSVAAVALASLVTATQPNIADLFLMTDAVELTGTPGGYYFVAGTGSGANKWYVHHQGGGWCESIADCYGRSQTNLGSSKHYASTTDLDGAGGYFSSNATVNPMMWNWNKVYIQYCDGASYSGSNDSVAVYNGTTLHFRGKHILDAIMDDVYQVRGMDKASDIVISGCSAGGLATYLHADKWAEHASPSSRVVALPDSGFFLDYQGQPGSMHAGGEKPPSHLADIGPGVYHTDMVWVFNQQNVTSGVHQGCIASYSAEEQWKCMFAEYTAPFIKTPTFPLQSEYDSWQIGNVLPTSDDTALITQMGYNITARMKYSLLTNDRNGVFLDSCEHHCGMWGQIIINGDNQATAFQKWYENPQQNRLWVQGKPYPCKDCCQ